MRYFSYDTQDKWGNNDVVTKSEEEILDEYYPRWQERMINKYGPDKFTENFFDQDCIEDWIATNYAWEVDPLVEGE